MSWKCWNCAKEFESKYDALVACPECGAGKDGSPPNEERRLQATKAAVTLASTRIDYEMDILHRVKSTRYPSGESVVFTKGDERAYAQLEEDNAKKVASFAPGDERVIDEVKKLVKQPDIGVLIITWRPYDGYELWIDDSSRQVTPKSGGCFIATATYGSLFAPEVIDFRRFRDEILLKSGFGTALTKTYYLASPPFAWLISKSDFLKSLVKNFALRPLLKLLKKHFRF